jgi:hypothetical protein
MRTAKNTEKTGWERDRRVKLLPEGREQKAKELGAVRRAGKIKTAKDLLPVNLLYLTEAPFFGKTLLGRAQLVYILPGCTRG